MTISKGIIWVGQKVVIYGPAGVGKTMLASQFPQPVFIDVEGSTNSYNVARLPSPKDWNELIEEVKWARDNPTQLKTLIIDSADWAESLCIKAVCEKARVQGIEDFGYGKGYVYLGEEFSKLLSLLDAVIKQKIHVVFVAHAQMKKVELPNEMSSYDRWELKCSKMVAPKIKEWSDIVLFCNFKTIIVKSESGKSKGQGAVRTMYTQQNACWDAKNRFALDPELPMKYDEIGYIFEWKGDPEPAAPQEEATFETFNTEPKTPLETLRDMIAEAGVTETEVERVVVARGRADEGTTIDQYSDKLINKFVIKYWEQILALIKEDTENAE